MPVQYQFSLLLASMQPFRSDFLDCGSYSISLRDRRPGNYELQELIKDTSFLSTKLIFSLVKTVLTGVIWIHMALFKICESVGLLRIICPHSPQHLLVVTQKLVLSF